MDQPLADGRYDVMVVDVGEIGPGVASLTVVLLAGDLKGHVVDVSGPVSGDAVDALGLPGVLIVAEGRPSLALE